VGHALLAGERRKRITAADVSRSLELLGSLNIRPDDSGLRLAIDDWIGLARSQQLSVCDATYLALAMREGIPLATLDTALRRAARRVGVTIVPT